MGQDTKKKLLFLVSVDTYFFTHRINLGIAAIAEGYEVAVACRADKQIDTIKSAGIRVYPLKYLTRSGLNPFHQLLALKELWKIYKHYKPDVVHHVAMKPVLLGTLIAKLVKTPRVINAFGGLGYLFTDNPAKFSGNCKETTQVIVQKKSSFSVLLQKIKKQLLRLVLPKLLKYLCSPSHVSLILQNQDDTNTLLQKNCILPYWITHKKVNLIRGAGINTTEFPESPFPPYSDNSSSTTPIIIACVSRMLSDKGILELIDAAKILQSNGIIAQIVLYGDVDLENPASLRPCDLQSWHDQGIIVWYGYCHDVAKAYQACHIAVLPSYREGFPKSLLEAASTGRPIVTTDVPGCREIVQHNVNGFLVPAQNSEALAKALETLCLDEALRIKMGKKSRQLVETNFLDSMIHDQTLELYKT